MKTREEVLNNLAERISTELINFRDNGVMFDIETIKNEYKSTLTFVLSNKMPYSKARKVSKTLIEETTNNIINNIQNRF